MLSKKCINCGTTSQLRSSGVHVSDDGCIGVFADGDDFECSACGCTKAGTFYVYYDTDFFKKMELLVRLRY